MEKFFEKIEAKFNKEMENFEKSPIRTSLKWMVIIYCIKKGWSWIKEEEGK